MMIECLMVERWMERRGLRVSETGLPVGRIFALTGQSLGNGQGRGKRNLEMSLSRSG